MGRTAAALAGFDHPAAHRPFQWAAEEGLAVVAAHAPAVTDPARSRAPGALAGAPRAARSGAAGSPPRRDPQRRERPQRPRRRRRRVDQRPARPRRRALVGRRQRARGRRRLRRPRRRRPARGRSPRSGPASRRPCRSSPTSADVLADLVALRLATSVALSAHQSQPRPRRPVPHGLRGARLGAPRAPDRDRARAADDRDRRPPDDRRPTTSSRRRRRRARAVAVAQLPDAAPHRPRRGRVPVRRRRPGLPRLREQRRPRRPCPSAGRRGRRRPDARS